MFNKSKKSSEEISASESGENFVPAEEVENVEYEFEFKFVDGMKEIEKKNICGEGKNESEAMMDARKKADAESNGKFTVVFSGNFKKL